MKHPGCIKMNESIRASEFYDKVSMFALDLKGILSITIKARHDSYTGQFTRIFMPKICIICSLVMGFEWFHDKVGCILPRENKLGESFVHSACWIQGLFIFMDIAGHKPRTSVALLAVPCVQRWLDQLRMNVVLLIMNRFLLTWCTIQNSADINPSLVRWDSTGNYSNHGEILEHPVSLKSELKHCNISSLSKKTTP